MTDTAPNIAVMTDTIAAQWGCLRCNQLLWPNHPTGAPNFAVDCKKRLRRGLEQQKGLPNFAAVPSPASAGAGSARGTDG